MEKQIRIAITGPESTGKSAMALALSEVLACPLVPEYARYYLDRYGPAYTPDDIVWIASSQSAYEKYYSKQAYGMLICDTDILVCRIWSEFVFGSCPESLIKLDEESHYDFTLLMDTDLPWEPDPLREHPDKRAELLGLYQESLEKSSRPYRLISGSGTDRIHNALDAIKHLR